MKNRIICTLFICFSVCLSLGLASCKKDAYDKNPENANAILLELSDSNPEKLISVPQRWQLTKKKICVIFGYDFNKEEVHDKLLNLLQKRYGLAEDGGLIYPLVFPDDFKAGGRSYHNNLRIILEEEIENLAGVVILGAPENTHIALAKNQDYWDMDVPYSIVALFPQDDILGLEATCNIVLEKGQNIGLNEEVLTESENPIITEAPQILTQTIDYLLTLEGPLEKDLNLSNHVLCMLKNHKIHHYSDPETGLQSINHFVLN